MVREEILEKAKRAVTGEREQEYGSPEDSFQKIANLWTAYLGQETLNGSLTSADVANMMILFKVARGYSGPAKMDTWVDIAGYAACGGEAAGAEEK